jgi:apolipoprotein D and lipocalin family protein
MFVQSSKLTTSIVMMMMMSMSSTTARLADRTLQSSSSCKTVTTVENFDLDTYVAKPWYSHEQAVNTYSPLEQFYCVRAKYTVRDNASFWRYSVNVDNYAQDANGNTFGGPLCAYPTTGQASSKLAVAPCFLPRFLAGPYWIVAYNEDEGYALISGGQPTIPTSNGLCKTGQGVNGAGLWIFSRSPVRNETLVSTVRDIATNAGYDTSVLFPVNHTAAAGCNYP